jgi:hypothetical protein
MYLIRACILAAIIDPLVFVGGLQNGANLPFHSSGLERQQVYLEWCSEHENHLF